MPKLFFATFLSASIALFVTQRVLSDDAPPEVAKLIKDLAAPDAVVRLKAAKELANLKDKAKAAIPALTVATSDADEDVRAVAKRALATIKETTGAADAAKASEKLVPLVKEMQAKDVKVRLKAIAELELLGAEAKPAGAALVEYGMMNANAKVREAASTAYEKIDPEIHKHVLTILIDADSENKAQAVRTLQQMGVKAKGAVPAIKYFHASVASERSRRRLPPAYYTLHALVIIAPEDSVVRQAILSSVSAPDGAMPTDDYRADAQDRKKIIEDMKALKIDTKKQVEALLSGLAVSKSHRVVIIQELGKIGSDAKAALPALTALKSDGEKTVREAASAAIDAIKE